MKLNQPILIFSIWISLCLLASCGTHEVSICPTQEIYEYPVQDAGDLEFRIFMSKPQYKIGEKITAEVSIKNIGVTYVVINQRLFNTDKYEADIFKSVEFIIVSPDGSNLNFQCSHEIILNSDVDYILLGPNYQISTILPLHCYSFSEVGKYSISALYHNYKDSPNGRLAWKGTLESDVIMIEIVP